jgi:cell division protein FtsB
VLGKFFKRERQLAEQARELKQLRSEVAQLRAQNESMRQGMRRCITCDYRLQAKIKESQNQGVRLLDTDQGCAWS